MLALLDLRVACLYAERCDDRCGDMCMEACIDMCIDMCMTVCMAMCIHLCADMCIGVCTDRQLAYHAHMHARVITTRRPYHGCVCMYMPPGWGMGSIGCGS